MKNIEVEWYSGKELYTRPIRIKIDDIWEEVFHYEKIVREDVITRTREIVFRCHINDNRTIEITVSSSKEISEKIRNLRLQ